MNPLDQFNQLMNGINNPGQLGKGLGFGHTGGGMLDPYAPSQNINNERDNPNGITGAHQSNGAGFSGSKEHFITGELPQMNAKPIYDPTRGNYQVVQWDPNFSGNAEMAQRSHDYNERMAAQYQQDNGYEVTANGGVVVPTENTGSTGGSAPTAPPATPPTTPPSLGTAADSPLYRPEGDTASKPSTPFLDSYMRAREASKSAGPVSKTMSKYLEE